MNVAPSRTSTSFSRPGLLCGRRSRGAETLNRSRRADDERRLPSGAWACGGSPAKAARIANTGRSAAGRRGGKSPGYEEWSKKELHDRAEELGVEGRSKMGKGGLIDALRNHCGNG